MAGNHRFVTDSAGVLDRFGDPKLVRAQHPPVAPEGPPVGESVPVPPGPTVDYTEPTE